MVKLQDFLRTLLLVSLIAVAAVNSGCDSDKEFKGRDNGTGGDGGKHDEKPDPGRVVEKQRPLLLQVPTQKPEEFQNILQLEFTDYDQAAFSFSFAPEAAGSLYFSNIQSRLTLEGCTQDTKRKVKFNVVWQENLGTSRTVLQGFTPDITEYKFEAGKKYFLSFVLLDLKGQLSDCKSATLKFAVFPQNYSEVQRLIGAPQDQRLIGAPQDPRHSN